MTFANVQNVSVSRGPLQGLFGISDVVMKTAGGGGSERTRGLRPDLHVAHFHGLRNADEVRELVLDLLRKTKDAGLGDSDDPSPPSSVREEAKAFREAAERLA